MSQQRAVARPTRCDYARQPASPHEVIRYGRRVLFKETIMKACKSTAQSLRQHCGPRSHARWMAAGLLILGVATFLPGNCHARLTHPTSTKGLPFAAAVQFGT